MTELEFYIFEDELWCMYPNKKNERVTEDKTELIKWMIARIRECYPEAYKALSECYKKSAYNVPYFQFLIVNRFCRCNFGGIDNVKDVDSGGHFNFEHVSCPLRGECKYECGICGPKFNSKLSGSELRVMKLMYEGHNVENVADLLYLSPNTIKNHIKSVYLKLGIHEKAEFIDYAHRNNLFNA